MKIHSLSTIYFAKGGVVEVLESVKHVWSFRGKQPKSTFKFKSKRRHLPHVSGVARLVQLASLLPVADILAKNMV